MGYSCSPRRTWIFFIMGGRVPLACRPGAALSLPRRHISRPLFVARQEPLSLNSQRLRFKVQTPAEAGVLVAGLFVAN